MTKEPVAHAWGVIAENKEVDKDCWFLLQAESGKPLSLHESVDVAVKKVMLIRQHKVQVTQVDYGEWDLVVIYNDPLDNPVNCLTYKVTQVLIEDTNYVEMRYGTN